MRLEITQRADLAVRALVALQSAPTRLKSVDLADALGTTAGFVPQVMAPLVRAGWVRSVPGPTGGYERRRDLDSLTVLEVVETIDGPTTTAVVSSPSGCAMRRDRARCTSRGPAPARSFAPRWPVSALRS